MKGQDFIKTVIADEIPDKEQIRAECHRRTNGNLAIKKPVKRQCDCIGH